MINSETVFALAMSAIALVLTFGETVVRHLRTNVEATKTDIQLKQQYLELTNMLNTERTDLQKRVMALESGVASRDKRIEALEQDKSQQVETIKKLTAEIEDLRVQLDAATAELEMLRQSEEETGRLLREAHARETVLQGKIERLNHQLQEKEIELQKLREGNHHES